MKEKPERELHRELLRSFWAHVIEENEGDIEKIRKCFRGGEKDGST